MPSRRQFLPPASAAGLACSTRAIFACWLSSETLSSATSARENGLAMNVLGTILRCP
jgi:hypothetical protein